MQLQQSSSNIYLNLTKCSDLLDNIRNNLDPMEIRSLSEEDINQILKVLANVQGALRFIQSKLNNGVNFLT